MSFVTPLFIDMPIPRFESKPSCICVVRVSIVTLSMICLLDFGTVLALTYFFVFNIVTYFLEITPEFACVIKA